MSVWNCQEWNGKKILSGNFPIKTSKQRVCHEGVSHLKKIRVNKLKIKANIVTNREPKQEIELRPWGKLHEDSFERRLICKVEHKFSNTFLLLLLINLLTLRQEHLLRTLVTRSQIPLALAHASCQQSKSKGSGCGSQWNGTIYTIHPSGLSHRSTVRTAAPL